MTYNIPTELKKTNDLLSKLSFAFMIAQTMRNEAVLQDFLQSGAFMRDIAVRHFSDEPLRTIEVI